MPHNLPHGETPMKTRIGLPLISMALAATMALAVVGCSKTDESKGLPPPSTTVGTEIDDSVITTAVKSALLTDPDVKSFDLKVETRKGEVQLSGFVDNQPQVDRATSIAQNVSGTKSVQNRVSLKDGATSVGIKVDDGIVTTKVKAALLGDADVKSQDIAVVTRNGEVQLSGFVDNQGQIDRATRLVEGTDGVSKVINELSIKK
jgi:hyperosmotically inducible protein